ncbi:TPA: putative DNA-binding domain-containing protein [Stenotrophomonas maltophilia]|uniref:HvfC family RiPP maturation protein n=1 Tax=Stenotrophomonas TaxID=40323 RepID=UPI001AA17F3A|nr:MULTISPECIES: putative DNA-binding domain-containing protein [Stenotrophomonas]ELF4108104.1 putative DNA-binding domain-containing protein [Stenotrophomonas maltophilia]MBO1745162.1 putative DNA-binding domain-containing protein [Stenotrophomonas maltophilia]MCU1175763.1 putative DNA-binding domain-containing protein [Stenotrophomonas maltophilia]WAP03317.1 putative DNA-binding domain-containing protein [Stenotrophomonas sp. SBJS02]HEA4090763.1 putative DNA-binding domain-containing protein
MADATDTLRAQQHAFTAHLRDPESVPPPAGLEPRRVAVYQRLLFNNLLGLLSNGFPVCVRLLGEPAWSGLVRQYFATHRCQTPLFTELAAEFVEWLQAQPQLPHPALAELAHYEWVETALYQLPAEPLPVPGDIDPLRVPLQRSPLAWPLLYQWPVHRLGAGDAPSQPPAEPTGLLVRREVDGEVRFAVLSPLAVYLLSSIGERPGLDGHAYLQQLAAAHGLADDALALPGAALLQQFLQASVIGPLAVPS